jgi:hypothetical protein
VPTPREPTIAELARAIEETERMMRKMDRAARADAAPAAAPKRRQAGAG